MTVLALHQAATSAPPWLIWITLIGLLAIALLLGEAVLIGLAVLSFAVELFLRLAPHSLIHFEALHVSFGWVLLIGVMAVAIVLILRITNGSSAGRMFAAGLVALCLLANIWSLRLWHAASSNAARPDHRYHTPYVPPPYTPPPGGSGGGGTAPYTPPPAGCTVPIHFLPHPGGNVAPVPLAGTYRQQLRQLEGYATQDPAILAVLWNPAKGGAPGVYGWEAIASDGCFTPAGVDFLAQLRVKLAHATLRPGLPPVGYNWAIRGHNPVHSVLRQMTGSGFTVVLADGSTFGVKTGCGNVVTLTL